MKRDDRIESYLERYRVELVRQRVGGWLFRVRVLSEAESHLRESAGAIEREGIDPGLAEAQALRRFGDPRQLACTWLADPESADRLFGAWRMDWIAASSLGCLGGLALVLLAGDSVAAWVGMFLILPLVGLTIGAGLGLAQSVLLRLAGGAGLWVLASALGISVGLTTTTIAVEALGLAKGVLVQELAGLTVIGMGTGGATGCCQKLLARSLVVPGSDLVERSGAGAGLGTLTGGLVAWVAFGGIRTNTGLLTIAFLAALGVAAATAAVFHPRAERASLPE